MTEPAPSTIASINLSRLLSRLDRKLTSNSESTTCTSPTPLERAKLTANLEYARKLLHELESAPPTTHSDQTLARLSTQKSTVLKINQALANAPSIPDDYDSDSDSDSGDDSSPETDTTTHPHLPTPPTESEDEPSSPTPTSTLRHRFQSDRDARIALFARPDENADVDAEKALDVQRAEQEAITGDMLTLARALKENSVRFGLELEKEKGLLDAAHEGLDRNARGVEGAGRKMDVLRRDENVGFIWGMIYTAGIVALAFFTLFILFFAPKLRW